MIHPRILIIDDDEVDRKSTRRALAKGGWNGEIVEAVNAEEARTLAGGQAFDCILLDYRLPGTDGIDLLRELKTDLNVHSPIVMLTGEGNEMVAVEAMKRGASDYLPKSLLAADTLLRIVRQVMEKFQLQCALNEARSQLERQATYDSLTGLGNRNLFMRDLGRAIANAQRKNSSFGVLMMDLNKFKSVNDQLGHEAGDTVLAEAGRRLASSGRANDAFYRWGGDEFTALIDGVDDASVLPIIQRIGSAIAAPMDYKGETIVIGISVGTAVYSGAHATIENMLREADTNMYRAKHSNQGAATK